MECRNNRVLACHLCNKHGCEGLKDLTCVECMLDHRKCAWDHSGFDLRPFIQKQKDKYVVFCQKCEDRLKYGVDHICKDFKSMDFIDMMLSLPTEKLLGDKNGF